MILFLTFLLPFCLCLLASSVAFGATLLVVPSGGAISGACLTVPTSCTLTRALAAAVAGDIITLADGTYPSAGLSTGVAGSSGSRITLQATNPLQATLTGNNTCSPSNAALNVNDNYWTIKDLVVQDTHQGIEITNNANNIIIENVIINNFHASGVYASIGTSFITVRNALIINGDACRGAGWTNGGIEFWGDDSVAEGNLIIGTGNNAYAFGGPTHGRGLTVINADRARLQGNMLLANQGYGVLQILGDSCAGAATASNNVVEDNILLWGEGAAASSNTGSDDQNSFINNLAVGNYLHPITTKGNQSDLFGQIVMRHNTEVIDAFSRAGADYGDAGTCFGSKKNNTFQDNVLYSPDPMNFGAGEHALLWVHAGTTFITANHNFFWGNDTTLGDWTGGYTFGANDIHAFASPPTFTNTAVGDYTLATGTLGTPGNQPASDNTARGIHWNSFLRQDWAAKAFALQTVEKTGLTGVTSTFFTSSDGIENGKYYQVWFYIPNAPCSGAAATTQQFTVEGTTTNLVRDINGLTSGGIWVQPGGPARYITLGRHLVNDGVLNVSWQTANCVERVFIRELPTVAEAYSWMTVASAPPTITITAPNSGNDVTVASSPVTVSGSATDDVGVTVTISCSPSCGSPSVTGTPSWSASVSLQDGPNIVTATAQDADNPSVQDAITITLTPPVASTTSPVAPAFSGHWIR